MRIEYRVLGPLEVVRGGEPVIVGSPKLRALLGVLLCFSNERLSADRLIGAIWGDDAPGGALHTLRVHVSNLRRLLEPDHRRGDEWTILATVQDGYRLLVEPGSLDSEEFDRLTSQGRALVEAGEVRAGAACLREALSVWRGRAFEGVEIDSVVRPEAERLNELRLAALEDRIDADILSGRHAEVVGELRELTKAHPFRERMWSLLMLALYTSGRQAEALRAYRQFADCLGEEVGLEPSPRLRDLENQILLHDPGLAPDVSARSASSSNLPTPTTSFVGREEEVATARQLVQETRLLTFTGPGGVGKTRLAIESARAITDRFDDGVWLVELAPLRDPGLVAQTVAKVLKVDQQPDRPVEDTLAEQLRSRSMLIVLDNCEHLIEPAARLAEILLQACPGVRLVATSRESLGVAGETRLRVTPLNVPGDDPAPSEVLADHESVRLFADRAAATDASFTVTADIVPVVASICRRLDGIPLAIELAATRVGVLSLEQIDSGLDHRFDLLTTGSRTAEPRQQTLATTLDWSYDLLTEPERALLRWISVFRGTFGLEAVEGLHSALAEDGPRVLDLLANLVAKSLVGPVPSGPEMRYELLETIRQYARGKLSEAAEEPAAVRWHKDWYLKLADRAVPNLRSAAQLEWLDRLEVENDNLRAVLDRSTAAGDLETALRLAGSLAWFWFLHSHLREGWDRLTSLIGSSAGASDVLKARVLLAAGQFAWEQGKDAQAGTWLEQALESALRAGSDTHAAWAYAYLGLFASMGGRYSEGEQHAETACRVFEAVGNVGGLGFSMWVRVASAYLAARQAGAGDSDKMEEYENVAGTLLEAAREIGERNLLGHLAWSLGVIAVDRGDLEAAGRYVAESLEAFGELGNKSCLAHTLDEAARLSVGRGEVRRACRLLAATEALRSRLGIPGHAFGRRHWESLRDEVLEKMGREEAEAAWAAGSTMELSLVVEDALGTSADG